MRIVVRTDASLSIGTGHVVRCLTLAGALSQRGADVLFVCREHLGDSVAMIEEQGFEVHRLHARESAGVASETPDHDHRLGTSWEVDALETAAAIATAGAAPDWLVVDHYALDRRWESALRTSVRRIMAIDDVADRPHDCDLLLDQNVDNPLHQRYSRLLPEHATRLLGTAYALVRPEFAAHRAAALSRRDGQLDRILVSMGGTDPENDTAKAVKGLAKVDSHRYTVDVVIGASNRHREELLALCERLPSATLHVQTIHMATLMSQADVAIAAGGSTTWERCVVGLPAVVAIQSQNQAAIVEAIHQVGAHQSLGWSSDLEPDDYGRAIEALTHQTLTRMSKVSASLCDGAGATRVAQYLMAQND